jgi:hypothetical protein
MRRTAVAAAALLGALVAGCSGSRAGQAVTLEVTTPGASAIRG